MKSCVQPSAFRNKLSGTVTFSFKRRICDRRQ